MKMPIVSFYEYMQEYPQKGERAILAVHLKRLAKDYPKIKEIDSLADLFSVLELLTDHFAIEAVTGSLWCEYCTITGHPIS